MAKHRTNTIGKYILLFSCFIFLGLIAWIIVSKGMVEPAYLAFLLLIVSITGMTWSVSFIYYHSNIQKRNRIITIFSIISSTLLLLGIVSKLSHWIGASVEIIFAVFLFTGAALPLIIKNRYEKRKGIVSGRSLLLNMLDLVSILLICFGLLARLMHWYGSTYMIFTGIILLLIAFVLWNISFRREVKLRHLAEEQLKITLKQVEEKNKEITDSINYAKRLQEAIFPSVEFITNVLPNNFVLYRPKDIVAGDFYWAEKIDDTFLIAVADCTGHGVPGALVSVVCCNALNTSVKEFKLSEPGAILDKTRTLVLESFSKKGEQIKDGMDISMLSIKNNQLFWAGANNPIWIIRKNEAAEGFELIEIKGNRQAIGYTEHPEPFTTHSIDIQKGDVLYLFTDGFADQFGGLKGKKFKYKPFQELLKSISHLSLKDQQVIIEQTFLDWKGSLDQVDDLCVLAFRFD